MTDFAKLIEKTIARETRARLATFLSTYQTNEFGHLRQLDQEEIAMVLVAIDDFLLNESLVELRVAEISGLRARLSHCAHDEEVPSGKGGCQIRNLCFDALACIAALEAGLSKMAYGRARKQRPRLMEPAND